LKISSFYRDKNWLVFSILLLIVASFLLVIINSEFLTQVEEWIVNDVDNELSLRKKNLEKQDKALMESLERVLVSWHYDLERSEADAGNSILFRGHVFCNKKFVESNPSHLSWDSLLDRNLENIFKDFPNKSEDLIQKLDDLGPQSEKSQEIYRLVMRAGSLYANGRFEESAKASESLPQNPKF
jgi:hypothetical protein